MLPAQFSTKPCMVCGDPATQILPGASTASVCSDLQCHFVAARQASMPAFHFKCFLASQSSRIREYRHEQALGIAKRAQQLQEQKKIKAATEAADEKFWWEKIQLMLEDRGAPELVKVVIPKGPSAVVIASDERRDFFSDYLTGIMVEEEKALATDGRVGFCEQAQHSVDMDSEQPGATAPPEFLPNPLAVKLCTACAGGCCTKGGNTAYLTAQTMGRVRAKFPELSADDLRQVYLARLPAESMTGSCIYHTASGCALPRDLRSDTCNQYACEALGALPLATGVADAEPVRVVVLQRGQDKWRQSAVDLDNKIVAALLLSEAGLEYLSE